MTILAVDTSGGIAGVSIVSDGNIKYEASTNNKLTHSVNLMPMIEESLNRSGTTIKDIDIFACVVGPGSFTGVRIGVNTIRGMAHGVNKPVIAIDTLEALAYGVINSISIICPILDARANQVYGAAFSTGNTPTRLLEDTALSLPLYLEKILEISKNSDTYYFVGDGVTPYKTAITDILGDKAYFAPAHLAMLRPASVALLAYNKLDTADNYLSLLPNYLRAPQAERELNKRLGLQSNA